MIAGKLSKLQGNLLNRPLSPLARIVYILFINDNYSHLIIVILMIIIIIYTKVTQGRYACISNIDKNSYHYRMLLIHLSD